MSRLAPCLALLTAAATIGSFVVPGVALARSFAKPPPASPTATSEAVVAPPTADLITLDRAALTTALAAARAANLARFRAYAVSGVYPRNTYKPGLANVWRDDAGHYCAAASIIAASGQPQLVIDTGDRDNFIRLRDVTTGPLHDWILTSGLTQTEVDLIQRPFMRVDRDDDMPSSAIAVAEKPTTPKIDRRLRRKETARLRALYTEIETRLLDVDDAQLTLAVDELMHRPMLALATFGDDVRE